MSTIFTTSIVKEKDSHAAGETLGLEALKKMPTQKPDLAIIFGSPDYDYKKVFESFFKIIGEIQIIGCTSAGEFTEKEMSQGGIACAFITSDTHHFYTGIGIGLQNKQNEAIDVALANFPKSVPNFPLQSVMLFVDGLTGKGEEAVQATSRMLGGQVKLFGGAAGDNLHFKKTRVFGSGLALSDAVSTCLIASKKPIICSVKHGHHPISPALCVTKAKDNVLYEIEGKIALDVWKEYLQDEIQEQDWKHLINHSSEFLSKLLMKAGMITGDSYEIRFPISCNPDGSLNFICKVEKNSLIKIMSTRPSDQITSALEAAKEALKLAKNEKIAGIVVFDCACRGMILKERFSVAVEMIKDIFPDTPMIGVETYGEILLEPDVLAGGFHNASIVIMLIPE
ncbi:hypothetical protein PUV_01060 [Parachlamydia acanthamoebae UV-7]|uniref:FIST domain-containing protein n=3 Tax=Parachlamydia acanthamoebae TaxID=83552 RepID=F8KUZ1_PARAV|nr:FIST N-terminal domain-containing protein [Parachlamydia acanthamoebae]CCB85056.1 hypothetical protein PUV_01060 [Parachlamydia acanthamoebae UV-7]